MGQDVSILLAARHVPVETLVEVTRRGWKGKQPDHLVLLVGSAGPPSLKAVMPEFTALSLWADVEASPAPVAAELSRVAGSVLVITMADHSAVGALARLRKRPGQCGRVAGRGLHGSRYSRYPGSVRSGTPSDRRRGEWFTEYFLNYERGICIFGTGRGLTPGTLLTASEAQSLMEYDFRDADLECLVME